MALFFAMDTSYFFFTFPKLAVLVFTFPKLAFFSGFPHSLPAVGGMGSTSPVAKASCNARLHARASGTVAVDVGTRPADLLDDSGS